MSNSSNKADKVMIKRACCSNILTLEDYIKTILGKVPYNEFFKGIIENEEYLIIDEKSGRDVTLNTEYLLNQSNWISNEVLGKAYENTVRILGDKNAVFKAGRNICNTTIGTRLFLMRLAGVQTIINRLPIENAKFNRNKDIEIVENRDGYAVVRLHWFKDPAINKLFCDMNKGVYEGLGRLTNNPATVEEKICHFEGGNYCEYHIKWKQKPFLSRFTDLLRSLVYHDIVEELERKIEEIDDIRIRQEKLIELRTNELQKERDRVALAHDILSKYVAPQLSKKILDGEVEEVWGHHRKKLTIFFSDIKDFTEITDSLESEDMGNLLNEYLSEMHDIVKKYDGTLAQIIGDGLLVFFGAPEVTNDREHALKCVRMAIEMQLKMKELRKKWFNEGVEEQLEIRCGINTGMATVGGFGSKERKEYTAMGMQVNLASRLESFCESGCILITHSTWALIKDEIECEEYKKLEAKGFTKPIKTYLVKFQDLL
jgi:class 3 adenylate cyclase